ncbi:hypothetical protein FOA52_016064 [Chlamydomonas sp. UWO 241]|nr:hypothetical protein FOA52_016064 [Chlamydomonas sp. UWO 241]
MMCTSSALKPAVAKMILQKEPPCIVLGDKIASLRKRLVEDKVLDAKITHAVAAELLRVNACFTVRVTGSKFNGKFVQIKDLWLDFDRLRLAASWAGGEAASALARARVLWGPGSSDRAAPLKLKMTKVMLKAGPSHEMPGNKMRSLRNGMVSSRKLGGNVAWVAALCADPRFTVAKGEKMLRLNVHYLRIIFCTRPAALASAAPASAPALAPAPGGALSAGVHPAAGTKQQRVASSAADEATRPTVVSSWVPGSPAVDRLLGAVGGSELVPQAGCTYLMALDARHCPSLSPLPPADEPVGGGTPGAAAAGGAFCGVLDGVEKRDDFVESMLQVLPPRCPSWRPSQPWRR